MIKDWLKDNLVSGLKTGADWILPSYPEGGTQDEINEYYDKVFSRISGGGDLLYGIIDYAGQGDLVEDMISGDPSLALRYFGKDTSDLPLFENQEDIDIYLQGIHNEYGSNRVATIEDYNPDGTTKTRNVWYPSTNPDFHDDDGWEFLRYGTQKRDKELLGLEKGYYKDDPMYEEAYQKLGKGTTVRRRFDENTGQYEYQIVDEYDFLSGGGDAYGNSAYGYFADELEKMYGLDATPEELEEFYRHMQGLSNLDTSGKTPKIYTGHRPFPDWLIGEALEYFPDLTGTYESKTRSGQEKGETLSEYDQSLLRFLPNLQGLRYLDKIEDEIGYDITGISYIQGQ